MKDTNLVYFFRPRVMSKNVLTLLREIKDIWQQKILK